VPTCSWYFSGFLLAVILWRSPRRLSTIFTPCLPHATFWPVEQPVDMEGILKVTKFPRAHLFGLRRDGSGRHIAGASFEEATQGSLCESIRAGQMVEHALMLHISEEVSRRELCTAPHLGPHLCCLHFVVRLRFVVSWCHCRTCFEALDRRRTSPYRTNE